MSEKERILGILMKLPSLAKVLRYAVEWEENPENKDILDLGWERFDVHALRSDVEKLVVEDIARVSSHSAKFMHFRLMDRDVVKQALKEFEAYMEQPLVEEAFKVPWDLFEDVVGYDEVKELFLRALDVGKIHFLLVGPPSSAKTLFLLCLERLPKSRYVLGSRVTKAGLSNYLISYKPRVLLIDEVDKMSAEDYGILLSLCETGRVIEMVYGRTREVQLDTVVFGCCNTLKGVPPEVISRFEVLRFKEYTREEFINVVENVLGRRGVESDLALYIAKQVWDYLGVRDPREAIRISRLAKTREDVDSTISWIKKYR